MKWKFWTRSHAAAQAADQGSNMKDAPQETPDEPEAPYEPAEPEPEPEPVKTLEDGEGEDVGPDTA